MNHDLKLRFRGKGSGFKEGRGKNKRESSNEPLQHCVSSTDLIVYQRACIEVENLLKNIYKQRLASHGQYFTI